MLRLAYIAVGAYRRRLHDNALVIPVYRSIIILSLAPLFRLSIRFG